MLWGQRICDPGPLYTRAQGPRQGETLPRTCNESPNGLEMWSRTILSSASQNLEGKNSTTSKAAPSALPEERTSIAERAREYSVGAVQGKTVTSALNVPTNVLAALMGKWPLNSVALVAATNRRWGKVADGTSTEVVTYLINRWKVRINWEGLYTVRWRALCIVSRTIVT